MADVLGLAPLKVEGGRLCYDPYPFQEIALGYTITREFILATPHIWIPKALPITPVELVATAAVLAIVQNPIVTRRFWQGWLK